MNIERLHAAGAMKIDLHIFGAVFDEILPDGFSLERKSVGQSEVFRLAWNSVMVAHVDESGIVGVGGHSVDDFNICYGCANAGTMDNIDNSKNIFFRNIEIKKTGFSPVKRRGGRGVKVNIIFFYHAKASRIG